MRKSQPVLVQLGLTLGSIAYLPLRLHENLNAG